jgi:hypothetical protein
MSAWKRSLLDGLRAPSIVTVALLAACGGPQGQAYSASVPASQANSGALLYVSWEGGVNVYGYPSDKLVTTLNGFVTPEGLCADKAGNIFITDTEAHAVYEYAHGGKQPIQTLTDTSAPFRPIACGVDPVTNDLAVTSAKYNDVFIFTNETGTPTIYNNPYSLGGFCTYDGSGDLFTRGARYRIAELPKGSSTFEDIKLSEPLKGLVGVAWDGKSLSINSENHRGDRNYRVRVRGGQATIVRAALLGEAMAVQQFVVYNGQLIGADQPAGQISFWKYSNIGNPIKTIELEEPFGLTVSVPQGQL